MSSTSSTAGVKVFVSYRRDEAEDAARGLKESISLRRRDVDVFFDRDSIGPGRDFAEEIASCIDKADVVLAVIGERWGSEEGLRRLADDEDWVRRELEAALARDVPIIPVLIHGVRQLPGEREVPGSLKRAFQRQAVPIHNDDYDHSLDKLVECLDEVRRKRADTAASPTDHASEEPGPPAGPPDYVLSWRAKLNGGSIDISARELLKIFGRQHLTDTAREELDDALGAAGLRCQPNMMRLVLDDRVRITRQKDVPEFQLRAEVDTDGPVTKSVRELLELFGHRRFTDKTRHEIEDNLRYVGLVADPRITRADKDGIVVISST